MKFSERILKFQEGGPMPAEDPAAQGAPVEEGAPAPAEGAAPQGQNEQVQQIAGQLVEMLMQQIGNPEAVMAVLQAAAEIVAQSAQPEAPVYSRKNGGRLTRKNR